MRHSSVVAMLLALSLAACSESGTAAGPMEGPVVDGEDAAEPGGGDDPDDGDDKPVDGKDARVPVDMTPGDDDVDAGTDDAGGGEVDEDAGELDSGEPEVDAGQTDGGSDAGPVVPWYSCQSSDQAFVRTAIMAVLGRKPASQAEVNMYIDLIGQIDAADGVVDDTQVPGTRMRRSRRVMLQALFKDPLYMSYWSEVYRDLIRVQRMDEYSNSACQGVPLHTNPVAVADYVRSNPATTPGTPLGDFNMYDVLRGALTIDDITPFYTSNLLNLLSRSYAGANAIKEALELGRRADFGAWFDAAYLNRDVVCLSCHNSEFSVTQTANPATNRHFPLPALLEKSLFGFSSGPESQGGFDGVQRAHGALRYGTFTLDCSSTQITQAVAGVTCPTSAEMVVNCEQFPVCMSQRAKMETRPWGWATTCGRYVAPDAIKPDVIGVNTRFGNNNGLRANPWALTESLRVGFQKLKTEGLGADPTSYEVADPDKAFAYLVAMNIADKVWTHIVGTPLTIVTRFPRNAASRDQLKYLTDTFIASGFSHKKLLEAVLASPYVNAAPPEEGCGSIAYPMPAVFDPWVIADQDPLKHKNSLGDAVAAYNARTARHSLFNSLNWPIPSNASFPHPNNTANAPERMFQQETGFWLKNSEPGFRGFDFQARLGWETRFAQCGKETTNTAPDFIDDLSASITAAGQATVKDLIVTLKDRLLGDSTFNEAVEKPVLEAMLGASLSADATTLSDRVVALRKVCGALVSSPQFMMSGFVSPDNLDVPKLTPPAAKYGALCNKLDLATPDDINIVCKGDAPMSVFVD